VGQNYSKDDNSSTLRVHRLIEVFIVTIFGEYSSYRLLGCASLQTSVVEQLATHVAGGLNAQSQGTAWCSQLVQLNDSKPTKPHVALYRRWCRWIV